MGRYIDADRERQILALLELRQVLTRVLTIRGISRLTKTARRTVAAIAAGRTRAEDPDDEPGAISFRRVAPYVCDCGYLVAYRPCVICTGRAHHARLAQSGDSDGAGPSRPTEPWPTMPKDSEAGPL